MQRRKFNKILPALPLVFKASMATKIARIKNKSMTMKNKGLTPGSYIGLVTPGSSVTPSQISIAKEQVASLGFKYKEGNHITEKWGYLAGTDFQRIEDLHSMYADKSVSAIWCIRGGYGCSRLLENLDYDLIADNPKPLIGFSDITALLLAIHNKTGKSGYHGPNAGAEMNPYDLAYFTKNILTPQKGLVVKNPSSELYIESNYDPLEVIRPGKAEGKLVGGNLSLLSALAGTPYELKAKNKLVFIEEIGEDPYRVDRMLTQLIQVSDLAKAKGIMLGQFRNCSASNPENSLTLAECLQDRLAPLGMPIVSGMSFGHVKYNFTIPFGKKAVLDSSAFTLTIEDPWWR